MASRPSPRLGNERENWRRAGSRVFTAATYSTMGATLVVGALGFTTVATALAVLVVVFAVPAAVLGRI